MEAIAIRQLSWCPLKCSSWNAGLEFHLWARTAIFHFFQGQFHQKILKVFWKGTKAETRASEVMACNSSPRNIHQSWGSGLYWDPKIDCPNKNKILSRTTTTYNASSMYMFAWNNVRTDEWFLLCKVWRHTVYSFLVKPVSQPRKVCLCLTIFFVSNSLVKL